MTVVVNQSTYPVQAVEHAFWHGNRYHCISAKVTLAFDAAGRLGHLLRQPPLELNEVWYGRPMRSSLRHPGDLIPYKPTTDILVVGTAHAPQGQPTRSWTAELRFEDQRKRLRLHGPRAWRHRTASGWTLTPAAETTGVDLRYENAFGGVIEPDAEVWADGEFFPDNPFGRGFLGRSRGDTHKEYPAAQIEAWDGAITRFGEAVPVGGFGPVPGFVPSRARYMGTWDDFPAGDPDAGVPLDMDMRYWNCAPPDQQTSHFLREGDRIELHGLLPEGAVTLAMPGFTAMTVARYADDSDAQTMKLDTVLIDLDARHLALRYHRIIACDASIESIQVYCAPHRDLNAAEVAHG